MIHSIIVNKFHLDFFLAYFYLRHLSRNQRAGSIARAVKWHYPAVRWLSRYGLSCVEISVQVSPPFFVPDSLHFTIHRESLSPS
jgi:hypothetical protein